VVIPTVAFRSILWLAVLSLFVLTACTGDDDPTATPQMTTPAAAGESTATPTVADEPTSAPAAPTTAPDESTATPVETDEPTTVPDVQPDATPTEPAVPELRIDLDAFDIDVREVTGGLNSPVKVVSAYDGSNRIFIVEKDGTISVVLEDAVQDGVFLDISERVNSSGSEQGLLGLAFHPEFAANGLLYVNYTDLNGDTVVSRFEAGPDGASADPASETVIMTIEQPASNHNGGHLLFGPDGYLYIGTGDGGGSGDTFQQAQNPGTLLGKMLRIDVDAGEPYGIPAGNPFADNDDVLDEIWAVGLRNPWRYDFDRQTGDLYIADVGQNRIEAVHFQPGDSPGGENYGWPILEGTECFQADECDQAGLVLPVTEYMHDMGCSITGGNVYRGEEHPEMTGVYFHSDFCSGNIWGLANVDGEWQTRLFLQTGYNVSSFGEDESGEIYLVDMYSGVLYRIIAI